MSNKHVIFAQDTKKKKVDKEEESVLIYDTSEVKSYSFAYNKERKAYDVLTVTIDLKTMESSVTQVDKMRYDSEARAIMEIQKRVADDVIKKGRKR